jgi:hypothetical protein
MSHIYPEIALELDMASSAFEGLAEASSVTPPPALKTSILDAIEHEKQDSLLSVEKSVIPNTQKSTDFQPNTAQNHDDKITLGIYKIAAVLLVSLTVGASYLYIDSKSDLEASNERLSALESDLEKEQSGISDRIAGLEYTLNESSSTIKDLTSELEIVKDPSTFKIALKGTDLRPNALASVYFNPDKEQIYIESNQLDELAESYDYQLWAIVDGKPVDMGVFNPKLGDLSQLQKVDYIKNPQAFAITIEPVGGSIGPTLEKMVVLGTVDVS